MNQFSEPIAYAGQEPARFLAAQAERCVDALRRSVTPILPCTPEPHGSRPIADAQWHSKDEFLAVLAHELRNPLMPIRCALEVIENAKGDAARVEQAYAIVKRQFAHMVRLLDDMFDEAASRAAEIVVRKERIDLHGVLKCAVEAVKPLMTPSSTSSNCSCR